MNVCFPGTRMKMKMHMMYFYRQIFLLNATLVEIDRYIYRPKYKSRSMLLHTFGQAKLTKGNKRDLDYIFYILLPLSFLFIKDKQKKPTNSCKKSL